VNGFRNRTMANSLRFCRGLKFCSRDDKRSSIRRSDPQIPLHSGLRFTYRAPVPSTIATSIGGPTTLVVVARYFDESFGSIGWRSRFKEIGVWTKKESKSIAAPWSKYANYLRGGRVARISSLSVRLKGEQDYTRQWSVMTAKITSHRIEQYQTRAARRQVARPPPREHETDPTGDRESRTR
jgi:hypothetical protein